MAHYVVSKILIKARHHDSLTAFETQGNSLRAYTQSSQSVHAMAARLRHGHGRLAGAAVCIVGRRYYVR